MMCVLLCSLQYLWYSARNLLIKFFNYWLSYWIGFILDFFNVLVHSLFLLSSVIGFVYWSIVKPDSLILVFHWYMRAQMWWGSYFTFNNLCTTLIRYTPTNKHTHFKNTRWSHYTCVWNHVLVVAGLSLLRGWWPSNEGLFEWFS